MWGGLLGLIAIILVILLAFAVWWFYTPECSSLKPCYNNGVCNEYYRCVPQCLSTADCRVDEDCLEKKCVPKCKADEIRDQSGKCIKKPITVVQAPVGQAKPGKSSIKYGVRKQ